MKATLTALAILILGITAADAHTIKGRHDRYRHHHAHYYRHAEGRHNRAYYR